MMHDEGVRPSLIPLPSPSLIPLLIRYLSDRKMSVRLNNEVSEILTLIGGGPQGTLFGGLEYIVQSNDNSDCVDSKDRFKYIDDLSILQLIFLSCNMYPQI